MAIRVDDHNLLPTNNNRGKNINYRIPISVYEIPDRPSDVVTFATKEFEKWRGKENPPIQKKIVADILNARTPFVFLNAPTGSGKSLIGMAVAQYWVNFTRTPVIYTTKDTTLQDQIWGEFEVPVIKGRKNYYCPEHNTTADNCPYTKTGTNYCPLVKSLIRKAREYCKQYPMLCPNGETVSSIFDVPTEVLLKEWGPEDKKTNAKHRCNYLFWRELARRRPISVLNYHYLFYALFINRVLRDRWPKPGLIIIDEAHLFPDALADMYSKTLNLKDLEKLELAYTNYLAALTNIKEILKKDIKDTKENKSRLATLEDTYEAIIDFETTILPEIKLENVLTMPIDEPLLKRITSAAEKEMKQFKQKNTEVLLSLELVDTMLENLRRISIEVNKFLEDKSYIITIIEEAKRRAEYVQNTFGNNQKNLTEFGIDPRTKKMNPFEEYTMLLDQIKQDPHLLIEKEIIESFAKAHQITEESSSGGAKKFLGEFLRLINALSQLLRLSRRVSEFTNFLGKVKTKLANLPLRAMHARYLMSSQVNESLKIPKDSEYVITLEIKKNDRATRKDKNGSEKNEKKDVQDD